MAVFVCMIDYGNEVCNMIVVTLRDFVGKICSAVGPVLEELEDKKYPKLPKMLKYH